MKHFSTLLLIICLSFRIFGQQETMPKACTNPGNGILVGGGFSVSPQFACLDFSSNSATIFASNAISPSGGQLSNLGYIFNFKDGDNLNFQTQTSTTVSKAGTYWIMQGGNEKGQAYITCKSFEVIQTEQPDVKISSCGEKNVTVTFLNTPKNRTHGKYRVVWGDGNQDFVIPTQASFPFEMNHIYINAPMSLPQIVAIYTRENKNEVEVCRSTPYPFNPFLNNKPVINELEGLNGGESVKLTISSGLDGQEYTIQKKTDKGSWADSGKKIIRNSGVSSVTQTIEGLSKDSLYCFRLQARNICINEAFSNELCQIKLNVKIINDKETYLSWNIPSQKVRDYLIFYSENPNGTNPNRIVITQNFQKIDFLDCRKKYNFQIFATIDSIIIPQIRTISLQTLIDLSSVKELPAPESISTVSVDNSNTIKYSILETSGKTTKYLYYRSVNGNSYEKVAESTDNFYIDKNVDLSKNQYCYAYKYENECGVQSALSINKNCNVKLSLNNTNLEWTPFSIDIKSKAIPEYTIEGLNEDNSFISQVGTTTKNNFNILDVWNIIPNNITKFRIQAKITEGTFPSIVYSNSVALPILSTSKEADRFNIYPNPSEDFVQLNSIFQLKTAEIVDLQGKIIENQSIENGQVSVKHLPKGKYILRLYGNDKKLISSKAIIKN